jgi:flagellar basal body-associated protein FliL
MQTDDKPPARSGRGFLIVLLIVVAVVLMVVLHLTGVVGPGSH